MNVLMIHVGNRIANPDTSTELFLLRKDLLTNNDAWYSKHDIINADSQMQSLVKAGVNISYGHFSERKSIRKLFKAASRIRAICKQEKIDVVHVMWGTTTALITVLCSPVPVVISFCGSDLLGTYKTNGKKTFGGRLNTLFSQIAALFAKKIICKSAQLKRTLWTVSANKATVIPNGVDLNTFSPMNMEKARTKLNWKHNNPVILFFSGNGQTVKNRPLALAAFEIACKQLTNLKFKEVYGVSHEEISLYYNAANVMLLTSFHEGSNNSVKEALACNMPVVSVNVGDMAERLKNVNNCFITDTYNADILANSIVKVITSNQRSNGRDFSLIYSMENVARQIIEVYNQVKQL